MSKQQKKPEKSKPMLPVEEHKRELAKKNEVIKQVKVEMQRIKSAALSATKDYKERFDQQVKALAAARYELEVESEAHDAAAAQLNARINKLNASHGDTVKKLREKLQVCEGDCKCAS